MAKIDHSFHNLLGTILAKGFRYEDSNRKGTYRIQVPSYTFEWDFKDGFPALTTKRLWWKGVVGELLFFLEGDMDIRKLWANEIHIWDKDWMNFKGSKVFGSIEEAMAKHKDAGYDEDYSLGKVYGQQWRNYRGIGRGFNQETVDQFQKLIETLKVNPMSTSNIITAWNPVEKPDMALPPCHWSFEILSRPLTFWERVALMYQPDAISTSGDLTLVRESLDEANIPTHAFTLKWHQRSVDTFLGLPFNIASYALLAHIIGKMTNMIPDGIIGDLSNVHIYEPHMDAVQQQLSNDMDKYGACDLEISEAFSFESDKFNKGEFFTVDRLLSRTELSDFKLKGYESYKPIKAEMIAYDKK